MTVKQPFPMPNIEEQFAQLAGNKYFTTLDLRLGYHQIEIEESSKHYTAFVTSDGHFEFNRMPFGLVNAPATFQCIMNKIASGMNAGEVLVYLDDIVIPSKTISDGLLRLKRFFKLLKEAGLTLRPAKCKFLATRIEYLGHTVDERGVTPGLHKVAAIRNFQPPTTVTEVRRFLGLTGFFRKFVRDYSIISKPLTTLLTKANESKFSWGSEQQRAFENLINILTHEPVLVLYDYNAKHEVHTDASSIGLAGVLLQSADGSEWHPVFYYSRHCTDTESRYHSYELEVLAIVETLERFRIYLIGKHFRLITDCSAVAHIKENKEMKPKIARWWLKLLEYDFECIHRQGSCLQHVDALSRMPDQPEQDVEPAGMVMNITDNINDWLLTMQLQDEKLRQNINILNGTHKSPLESTAKAEYELRNHRLYKKTTDGPKFVVPKGVRWRVIHFCHDQLGILL